MWDSGTRKDDAKGEDAIFMALRGVMECMGLNGMARALACIEGGQAAFVDRGLDVRPWRAKIRYSQRGVKVGAEWTAITCLVWVRVWMHVRNYSGYGKWDNTLRSCCFVVVAIPTFLLCCLPRPTMFCHMRRRKKSGY